MQVVMGALNGVWLRNLLDRSAAPCSFVQAAVAYAQPNHPFFDHCKKTDVRLQYYGLLDDNEAVSTNLLRDFLQRGPSRVDCRLLKGHFHPKVIWWHGFGAYIGSANLTQQAWFNNVECGVFYDESELVSLGIGPQLEELFSYLQEHAVPLTEELLAKLVTIAKERRRLHEGEKEVRKRFDDATKDIPPHRGLTAVAPKEAGSSIARRNFVREWTETLQLLRGLAAEFAALRLRPRWVADDAHPAVHFDQFLHAYYYVRVREGGATDEDDEGSSVEKVERAYELHRGDPRAALQDAASWWASLTKAPYGEEKFIRVTAPTMQRLLSRESLASMTAQTFHEAMRDVNAFRMHARQVKNAEFGLPPGHSEKMDKRIERLASLLWEKRTGRGRTVREVLEFVIWGTEPADMELRLWLAVSGDEEWALPHFGKSTLGEATGWARPDDYPPRNNRTNKALRALGHDVKLYYAG